VAEQNIGTCQSTYLSLSRSPQFVGPFPIQMIVFSRFLQHSIASYTSSATSFCGILPCYTDAEKQYRASKTKSDRDAIKVKALVTACDAVVLHVCLLALIGSWPLK